MVGIYVGENNTWIECYPVFAGRTKFGFRIKSPFHLDNKAGKEYGVAFSGFKMWTMWGYSAWPRNPFSVFWYEVILRKLRRVKW